MRGHQWLESHFQSIYAAVASLLLILFLCAFAMRQPSHGVAVELLHQDMSLCAQNAPLGIKLYLESDGKVSLNRYREIERRNLRNEILDIYGNRSKRYIYLIPDGDLSVQEIAAVAAELHTLFSDMRIGVVTRQQWVEFTYYKSDFHTPAGTLLEPDPCLVWPQKSRRL